MIIYLSENDISFFNKAVIQRYSPEETIGVVDTAALNMVVNLPKMNVFGRELYPDIYSKATILFIQLVKKHCFANANKRTAAFTLVHFLKLNGYSFVATNKELVDISVEIAISPLTDVNIEEWTEWVRNNCVL